MTTEKPAMTLDMSGHACPAPLVGAKRIVDDLEPGQTMLLISDCPGTADDLYVWARVTGNEVVTSARLEGKQIAYTIRKGGIAHPAANVVLDIRGVSCPGPIVEAKKMLDGMQPGEVLQLISNCPGTPADIQAWAKIGHIELMASHEGARGVHEFFLRRK